MGTILCPATVEQWEVEEPGPWDRTPRAERSRKKHTDEASATSVPFRPVREELDAWGKTRVDSETSLETQTDPLVPCQTPSISASPPRGGGTIPRASAPVSTGCLLQHCGPPGYKLLEETATSLGTTGEFGTPVYKVDVTVNPPGDLCWRPPMLSERTSTWWPLRSARKFLRARNTANISRQLLCHERWWFFHIPWLEHPSIITPQPVRESSVVSILRQDEAPSIGPWDRNQGFFHITKARKYCGVTLIMRKGLPLWENPLVLSHHCRGLMHSSPKGITLDAAAIRPNSLWNCFTVSDWPSLILFTADRMDSIRAGDRRACYDVESHATPRKVVLGSGETHSSWHLAVTPILSCGQERHLDAELPTDATELESTNRWCSSICEYLEDTEAPELHLCIF